MKKILLCGLAITATFVLNAADFKFGDQTLTVPDGFEIELVAGTNLAERPVSMDFDEQGRLYVTDSSGSNEKVQEQLAKKPHRVVRLEDSDGDGRFDKSVVYADKMMFPEGCMWLDGSVYVSAPPSIWKLTDTDGDGVADKREEWHEGKTLTGCANDLHGPYLGPDGFIYWCKGAFAEQTYEINGKPFTTKASHIFRARPDKSHFESVMTGGMDNPVGMAFSATGERFLAGTFFEPQIPGRRDGVIHAIYGGVYGKPNAVLEGHKRTGDLMPVMIHLGPSASTSVIQYRSGEIGEPYRDNLFVCNFNLRNVTRHVLKPSGASFETQDHVVLSSDNPDFHPTCILEDADGSLLVIDTGGWYKICCPTSQLYKPDVLGAIYRIRRKGAHKIEDPRGLKIDWQKAKPPELTKFLDDKRPYVVTRAIQQLAKLNNDSIPAVVDVLKTSKSEDARRNAVWVLTQIDSTKAREAVLANAFPTGPNSYLSPDNTVAHVALYSISLWRDTNVISSPRGDDFFATVGWSDATWSANQSMRRMAIETYGRTGVQNYAVNHLLRIADSGIQDRIVEHSLIYALIELNDPERTASGLTNGLGAQRIALIALDQMDNDGLKAEQVAPFLLSTYPKLKQAASWIIERHPEWGDALAGFFREQLSKDISKADPKDREDLQNQLAKLAGNNSIQELLASTLRGSDKAAQLLAARSMARAGLKETPASWAGAISSALGSNDAEVVRETVLATRSIAAAKGSGTELAASLSKIGEDTAQPVEVRLNALAASPSSLELPLPIFTFLTNNLDSSKSVMIRTTAAGILAKAQLSEPQLLSLADALASIGPMELDKLLGAFEKRTNEVVGLKMVDALKHAKAFSSLRPEKLKPLFAKFPANVQSLGEVLIASLNADAGKQATHVDQLLASLENGDIRRGQAVFNSPKAACASCHAIGYAGGHVGPDLTKIGQVRTERDLLEAVVYPSASFVRSYEPMIVVTQSGDDYSGVLKKDASDEVVLVTGPNAEVKIARNDIAEMRPGTLSTMPQGLDEQLSRQELADLIAFLKATRW